MPTNVELLLRSIEVPGQEKVLTKEEETELGLKIQDPETSDSDRLKAVNTLVLRNIYLVLKLVHNKYKRSAFDFDDLVHYGILGLFSAARKYDPLRANRFASYARHWIRESIMKASREYSGVPKIPVYLVKDLWAVSRILSAQGDLSDEEVAAKAGLPVATVTHMRTLLFTVVEFDQEYAEYSWVDLHTPESAYLQKEKDDTFQEALDTLTEAERIVLIHSSELQGCKKLPFAQIESTFSIKHAKKLRLSAIEKLKAHPQLRELYQRLEKDPQ